MTRYQLQKAVLGGPVVAVHIGIQRMLGSLTPEITRDKQDQRDLTAITTAIHPKVAMYVQGIHKRMVRFQ